MAKPNVNCSFDTESITVDNLYEGKYQVQITLNDPLRWCRVLITPTIEAPSTTYMNYHKGIQFFIPETNDGEYNVNGKTYNLPDEEAPTISLRSDNFSVESYTDNVVSFSSDRHDVNITFIPDPGFKFKSISVTGGFNVAQIIEDGTKATYYDNLSRYTQLSVTAEVEKDDNPTPPTPPTVDDTITIEKTLVNCTGDIPETIKRGSTLNVTLAATPGYKFLSEPILTYINTDSYPNTEKFTVLQETTANISFDTNKVGEKQTQITIKAIAEGEEITGKVYGSINVYATNDEELGQFAQKRFYWETGTDPETSAPTYETIDLGGYVNRLFRLYTQIEATSEDTIKCGNYDTEINTHIPNKNNITLDFGTVKLPAHNDNITDLKSTYKLMLPFSGFIDISNEYAGRDIALKYEINVITGGALAIISTDNIPFLFKELDVKTDIIYRTSEQYRADYIGADEWNETLFYGLEPFILVEWYESIDYGRNNDRKRVIIGGCEGFNTFDEIDPIKTETMTNTEQSKIYELLESGVYIEKVEA